jgi:hypothetical protein
VKIEKYAAISEIVSSIAIVVTLAYLAIQTQQNTAAIVSSSRQQTLDAELGLIYELMHNPPINIGGPVPPEQLSPEQAQQQVMMLNALFRIREHMWLQNQSGLLDDDTWQSYLALISELFRSEVVRSYWRGLPSGSFASGFTSEVNSLLRETAPVDENR